MPLPVEHPAYIFEVQFILLGFSNPCYRILPFEWFCTIEIKVRISNETDTKPFCVSDSESVSDKWSVVSATPSRSTTCSATGSSINLWDRLIKNGRIVTCVNVAWRVGVLYSENKYLSQLISSVWRLLKVIIRLG
jgi:hypothetical protein